MKPLIIGVRNHPPVQKLLILPILEILVELWDDITKSAGATSTSTTTSTAANNGNIPDLSSVTTAKPADGGIIISASAAASSAPTNQPTVDPYFTHFDPRLEHQSYKVSQKEAQQRLEENHREKVTRKIEELVKEESQTSDDDEDLKKDQYADIIAPTTMESIQTDKYVAKELVTETSS
uniref:E2 domain-containing protein n=1 Tax=Megaselia scalaris TaxID=36166 RepID=T1GI50_MEGSC